jgi:DNA-directed RNA polymerase specialized sigma24 family protein
MTGIADLDQDIADSLRALVALHSADRDEASEVRPETARSELILARAGLSYQAIARLTGKKPEAVRSLLRRHKVD